MPHELADNAAFLQNNLGRIFIALTDPAFVHSDAIFIDHETRGVFAVFHEASHFLGEVSPRIVHALTCGERVLLSAPRPDGTKFELSVPVCH